MALSKSSSDTGNKEEEVCSVKNCGRKGVVGDEMIALRKDDPCVAGHYRQVRCKHCHNANTRIKNLLKKDEELKENMQAISKEDRAALMLQASI